MRSPCSKWMPPQRRDIPAASAALEKVGKESVRSSAGTTPGSPVEVPARMVTDTPNVSLPVKDLRTSAAAAEKTLCPEKYSGNGGVTTVELWRPYQSSPGIALVPCPGPPQAWIVWPA